MFLDPWQPSEIIGALCTLQGGMNAKTPRSSPLRPFDVGGSHPPTALVGAYLLLLRWFTPTDTLDCPHCFKFRLSSGGV